MAPTVTVASSQASICMLRGLPPTPVRGRPAGNSVAVGEGGESVDDGKVHVVEAADPTLASGWLVRSFLPVTEVRVVIEGDERFSWEAEVLV